MLITTSRKPGSRTRSFCQALNRVLNAEYINRGKMSMRDVLLKASQLGHSYIVVVFEQHGNPSKLTFYDHDGSELIYLTINVTLPENRINIRKDDLTLKCDVPELEFLSEIVQLDISDNPQSNYMWIKRSENEYKSVFEFFDNKSNFTGLRIFIKNYKLGEVTN